jgi:hypothetical protein
MPRKSEPSWNPIRRTRLENRKTLEEFAQECHVHLQAVYLNEMGMYPTILPSILKKLVEKYGFTTSGAEEEYQYYVFDKRFRFWEQHNPYVFGEPDLSRNPIRTFRNSLGYNTVFGFANAIAINPTAIRRVESCKVDTFPGQLRLALRDIRIPVEEIDDLEYQLQEYYHSGLRLQVRRGSTRGNSGTTSTKRREPD